MNSSSTAAITAVVWFLFSLAPILSLAVSATYFFQSPKSQPLWQRLVASSHGAAISLLYVAAMFVFWSNTARPSLRGPFLASLLLPVALSIASSLIFKGSAKYHWLQLVNLLCLAWTFFFGIMAVTGDWL